MPKWILFWKWMLFIFEISLMEWIIYYKCKENTVRLFKEWGSEWTYPGGCKALLRSATESDTVTAVGIRNKMDER